MPPKGSRLTLPGVIVFQAKGTPRPQPRPRLCRGRVVSTADPNAKRWIDTVLRAAHSARQEKGQADGALFVGLEFEMPTKDNTRWGQPHTFRPDSDNLAKLALDAMMKAGLLKDDATVSSLLVRKTWSKEGGLCCTINPDRRAPTFVDPERPDWV